jgi:hypothetical protein
MANHGKQRTAAQIKRHYAKPSRVKRHEKRADERVKAMQDDLAAKAKAKAKAIAEKGVA